MTAPVQFPTGTDPLAGLSDGERPVAPTSGHRVTIHYCTLCNWLLRSGWMAQELLMTFGTDLSGGVTLIPGSGGIFQVHCNGELIWDRKRDGGFPDARTLKMRVRDAIDPDRDLGHIDQPAQR
ncbi:MAG: SelT/SelW/SelH family protein [Lautropia sp.]|nr:SelT/SelW/SelH family protein [Lautropia sp.]